MEYNKQNEILQTLDKIDYLFNKVYQISEVIKQEMREKR